jgi:hypothetical protein
MTTIETQRSYLINQIEIIEDTELLNTLQSVMDFGIKHNVNEVSDWEKQIIKTRIETTPRSEYLDEVVVNNSLHFD